MPILQSLLHNGPMPRVSITIPAEVLDRLDRFCKENHKSRSKTVSRAVESMLNGAEWYREMFRSGATK